MEAAEPLPPHEIMEVIGRESSGAVCYRARDLARGAVVTLQVVGRGLEAPDAAAAFLREARAFAGLRLPYVFPVYAVGTYDGRPAFTTKFAPNGSLKDRLARFTDGRTAADLAERLARGAAAAHAHGLIHGRLCPDAVLFDEDDQPLICYCDLMSGALPEYAAVAGAPAYMAPELTAEPPGRVEVAADVWALGVLLYELLTGRRPFDGPNAPEIMRQVQFTDPIRPRRLRRDIDAELEAVVLRCLEKRPTDRYPSARALAEDLGRWQRGEPTASRPETLTRRILRGLGRTFGGATS